MEKNRSFLTQCIKRQWWKWLWMVGQQKQDQGWGWLKTATQRQDMRTSRRGLPGTDDQFVLPWVKGQLGVIHRALCFEPENPRLHLCHRQHKKRQQSANQSAQFMTAILINCLCLKDCKTLKTPGRFDLPSRCLFFVLPFFLSHSDVKS